MQKEEILLESGTNEVEILEFLLDEQSFGVNVAKIQGITQFDPGAVTEIPLTHPSMRGMLLFRNHTIPLIDLNLELGVPRSEDCAADEAAGKRIVLVMEFNLMTYAFLVDGVVRIHRISWQDISPLGALLDLDTSLFTGSAHIRDREVLIVDMEKIVSEIFSGDLMSGEVGGDETVREARRDVHIVLAEDSRVIRSMIVQHLTQGGYVNVTVHENGQEAHDVLQGMLADARRAGKSIRDYVDLVITDIEMPQMDGLTLCRRVKTDEGFEKLPVIVFSSLINEQMADKCRSVGADCWISKPQIGSLVDNVDRLCLEPAGAAV